MKPNWKDNLNERAYAFVTEHLARAEEPPAVRFLGAVPTNSTNKKVTRLTGNHIRHLQSNRLSF